MNDQVNEENDSGGVAVDSPSPALEHKRPRDGFDMDLYNVLPEARDIIAPISSVMVMTNGSVRDGKLMHPSVWNGYSTMLAFFALAPKEIQIEPLMTVHHKVAPKGYWTDSPCVKVSMEDAIRDCWVHHYGMHFECEGVWVNVWDSFPLRNDLMDLMFHVRGWRALPDSEVNRIKTKVLESLKAAASSFIGVTGYVPEREAETQNVR